MIIEVLESLCFEFEHSVAHEAAEEYIKDDGINIPLNVRKINIYCSKGLRENVER